MKCLIINGTVIDIGAFEITDTEIISPSAVYPLHVIGEYQIIDSPDDVQPGWRYDGTSFTPPVPRLPSLQEYVTKAQALLDAKAQERNYDGILSLCSYAADPDAKFRAEGQAGVEGRSATWSKCYSIMGDVEANTRPQPTMDEFVAELPLLTWPL